MKSNQMKMKLDTAEESSSYIVELSLYSEHKHFSLCLKYNDNSTMYEDDSLAPNALKFISIIICNSPILRNL